MTPKRQQFIEEYLVDLNATQAAIRAGYSAKTAYSQGQQLLKKTEIHEAIREARDARSERTRVTADYVLERLKAEAEYRGEGASHSARVSALTQLGKHLGIFTDKTEIFGSVNVRTLADLAREAADEGAR